VKGKKVKMSSRLQIEAREDRSSQCRKALLEKYIPNSLLNKILLILILLILSSLLNPETIKLKKRISLIKSL
jgi:hypothetical protein